MIHGCELMLCPEEVLIDFKELVGEHSGENLAELVWSALEMYGIEKKVCIQRHLIHGDTERLLGYHHRVGQCI
jgi:hypothetical protein